MGRADATAPHARAEDRVIAFPERVLSLSQPWCWAVMDRIARKHVENRSWAPPIDLIDKFIAIHAAKSWDDRKIFQIEAELELATPIGYLLRYGYQPPSRREIYTSGAIVGVARIDRVVTDPRKLAPDQQKWFFGPYGWVLTDVTRFDTPIPVSGKQGLWRVPDDIKPGISEQIRIAA